MSIILQVSGGTYSFKSTPNDRFLRNFPWQFYLLSVFLAEFRWEEIAKEIIFRILFCCLTWGLTRSLTSNKPIHYLLDYDDYLIYVKIGKYFKKLIAHPNFLTYSIVNIDRRILPKKGNTATLISMYSMESVFLWCWLIWKFPTCNFDIQLQT